MGLRDFLKRRNAWKELGIHERRKKQLVIRACHLCAAEFSLLSVVLFVFSACLYMISTRAFCLRANKLNHIYSEDKVYTRMVLRLFLSSAWKTLSILHLYSFLVYIG